MYIRRDDDDEDFYGRRNAQQRRDTYFLNIIQSVTEEENKSVKPEDEERLFDKICLYLKKPFGILGIMTLQKLAFIPPSVHADRLKDMAKIICKNVFNPLSASDYISDYVDFCKGFAYLKATTDDGVKVTFEQTLISTFLDELTKKFSYSQRLIWLLDNRDIPREKKLKWLEKQTEEQDRDFKMITHKSISFLNGLYQLFPEIVYRVIECLLKCDEEDGFKYLCTLLESVRYHDKMPNEEYFMTNIYRMKLTHWDRNMTQRPAGGQPMAPHRESLIPLLQRIAALSDLNNRLTENMRDVIKLQIKTGHPAKEHAAQDYIKYCIKDCLHVSKLNPQDDFCIEDEDEYDHNIYTISSKDFTSNRRMFFWHGLTVKILTKKSGKQRERHTLKQGIYGRYNRNKMLHK